MLAFFGFDLHYYVRPSAEYVGLILKQKETRCSDACARLSSAGTRNYLLGFVLFIYPHKHYDREYSSQNSG